MVHLSNESNQSEACSSERRSKRLKLHSSKKREEDKSFESDSESGKDFSPEDSDDYYNPPPRNPPSSRETVTRGHRGINAYRAAISSRQTSWTVQTIQTDASKVLPVSRGRGRGLRRRFSRGNRRDSRHEIITEHRQFVDDLEEQEMAHGSEKTLRSPTPKLPPLSDGNFN